MTEINSAFGLVRETDIVDEMQGAYLDYAMSVIVSRALPDVRDGLKPVHRRILYAMYHDLGLDHNKPHKKSARIVGEVLGKYHPHGDTAVYDAMVRMAQEFSLRYPLVDGQGNFGSVDGDGAAAMRYTEARLAEISQLVLDDLQKDTVDWHDNFDNSLREPNVLPSTLPNLLINGASGIAVGMSTNIPPHNLGEIVDALVFMIENFDQLDTITVDHLLEFVKGPDFPTGGIVYRYREEKANDTVDVVAQGYSVGRSRLIMQAKAHFEEMSRGRSRIVVTELPYQTNKVALLERIATLVRDGKIDGITDLRDESDRTGMRVVIELTRNVDPKVVLAHLFKLTPLQQTFGMQMLALVDGEPRTLGLKRMLYLFIQHRQEIIRRRSEYDLERAKQRAHILEGLLKALDILDEIIDTIRRSQNAETARKNLIRKFSFSQIQAQAILDMQLRRLAALERRRLQEEYKEINKNIAYLEDLLANPAKVLQVIKDDLLALKEKYGDARRTQIVDRTKGTLTSTDLLPDKQCWVTVAGDGKLSCYDVVKPTHATLQRIGKVSQVALHTANTRDHLYLFADDGRCRRVAIHEIPSGGKNLVELTDYSRRDDVTTALTLPRVDADNAAQAYLFLATEQGMVKRVTLADFLSAANGDTTVMNIDKSDRLRWVLLTQGDQEIILVSAQGQSIRFGEEDVRSMGLAAGGVGGMKLKKGDKVVHAAIVDPEGELMTMTENGYAKRTPLDQYSGQGRNGGGIVTHKTDKRTGPIAAALLLSSTHPPDDVIVSERKGTPDIVAREDVPSLGRNVLGKQIITLDENYEIVALRAVRPPHQFDLDTTPPVVDLPPTPSPATNGSNGHHGTTNSAASKSKGSRGSSSGGSSSGSNGGSSSSASNGASNGTSKPSASKRAPAKSKAAKKTKTSRTASASASKKATANAPAAKASSTKAKPTRGQKTRIESTRTQAAETPATHRKPRGAASAQKSTTKKSTSQKTTSRAATNQRKIKTPDAPAETVSEPAAGTMQPSAKKTRRKATATKSTASKSSSAQSPTAQSPTARQSASTRGAATSKTNSAKTTESKTESTRGQQASAKKATDAKPKKQPTQPPLLVEEAVTPAKKTTGRRRRKLTTVTSVKKPKRKG